MNCGEGDWMAIRLTDDELIDLFDVQLPSLLERRPEMEPRIYHAFLKTFARKEEVASVLAELRGFRVETRENFEQVDQRFEQVDQRFEQVDGRLGSLESRVEDGFREVQRAIDRLGARWGIRNESVFRQTVATLLEQSFGAQVEERQIAGEQFDCIIHDGEHILVEIAASAEKNIQKRLEHKRELYIRETGTAPTRVILVTASIHSQRAQALREAGFEVIEPEEEQADD
jgi:hypothetical protein